MTIEGRSASGRLFGRGRVGRRLTGGAFAPLALVAALAGPHPAGAQQLLVDTYTEFEGLPSSTVFDVGRAPSGERWLALRGGVYSYDGDAFERLFAEQVVLGQDVRFLRFDEGGEAWIFVDGRGVARARGETQLEFLPAPTEGAGLRAVGAFEVVGTADDPLAVVVTEGDGLLRWTGASWDRPPADERTGRALALEPFDGGIAVGTSTGLSLLGREGGLSPVEFPDTVAGDAVVGLASRADGSGDLLLLGTGWLGALTPGGDFELLAAELPLPLTGPFGRFALVDAGGGHALYGNRQVCFELDWRSGAVRRLGRTEGLVGAGINALWRDPEGPVWAAADLGAMKLVDLDVALFDTSSGLLFDEVSAVAQLPDGRMVMGHSRGLTILDGERSDQLVISGGRPDLPPYPRVMDLEVDRNGALWIAGNALGVGRLTAAGSVEFTAVPEELGGSAVAIHPSPEGLLVGSPGGVRLLAGGSIRNFRGGLPTETVVRRIELAADGSVYAATIAGLWVSRGGDFELVPTAAQAGERATRLFTVHEGADGRLWCGGASGLWTLEGGELVRPAVEPGVDRTVYSLIDDRRGRLWVGTDQGLRLLDGSRLHSLAWMADRAGYETNRAAVEVDDAGQVWIGTLHGVTRFAPDFDADPREVEVELTDVLVDGLPRPTDAPLELGARYVDLRLRARALSFLDERSVDLRYRIPGVTDWLTSRGSTVVDAHFTGLPSGEHRVEFQARGPWGQWGPVLASPPIVALAPLTARAWFVALVAAVTAGVVLATHRVLAARRQSRRLQELVEERTRDLEDSLIELARTEQLRSLGLLAGGIAHDLRNVLTVLTGNFSMLRRRWPSGESEGEMLDATDDALDRATQLASQLQTFATGGAPVLRSASLAELLRDEARLILSGSRVEAELDAPDGLWPARVDAGQVRQVIENLLLNACQSQPDGGWVRMTARNAEVTAAEAAARRVHAGRYVRLAIADGGPGVDPAQAHRIFDPFFTTKAAGTGIGLATGQSIARRHGGALYHVPDAAGATFELLLPAAESVPVPEEAAAAPDSAGAGERVLVVDDDEAIGVLLTEMLAVAGYEGVVVDSSGAALRAVVEAREAGEPLRLAIIDQTLPGDLSGVQILEALREREPELLAVASSGYSDGGVMARFDDFGFQAVLPKPYRLADLKRTLAELAARAVEIPRSTPESARHRG